MTAGRTSGTLSPDGLDAQHLTDMLRAAGACTGRVVSIARGPVGVGVGLIARLARLELE